MATRKELNLSDSIKWLDSQIKELKQNNDPKIQIKTYTKFHSWLDELLRYRLFLSEFRREIELTEPKSKEELLKLIDEEIKDWRLGESEIIE